MELSTKDLRIGNLITRKSNGAITEVKEVLSNMILCINSALTNTKLTTSMIRNFEPIPLTSDLLTINLGFITEMDNCAFLLKDGIGENKWQMRIWNMGDYWCWNADGNFVIKFHYVHELQNLFHSLTNTELIWTGGISLK